MKSNSSDTLTNQTNQKPTSKLIRKESLFKHGLDKNKIPLLIEEIEIAKNTKRVVNVENILEKFPFADNDQVMINPCFGDPENRDVLGGPFLTEEAFVKTNEFCNFEDFTFQKGGPRLQIALKPEDTVVAICLGGALCPGCNVAVRELVMCLWFNYGVKAIWGIKFGFTGCIDEKDWISLNPDEVSDIHKKGGSILGTNRGSSLNGEAVVDMLQKKSINVLFMIGGFGTIHEMSIIKTIIDKRGLQISTACIPKTLDNDIPLIDRSFGFETSVEELVKVIGAANYEASCTPNCVAIVRAFGREAGFTALQATNSSRDVNVCLVPEQKFNLYGEYGLLEYIFKRLKVRGHCVILVSEGNEYSILDKNKCEMPEKDIFGNKVYPDVGRNLRQEINDYGLKNNLDVNVKYIDPTYMIRSCPSNGFDTQYTVKLIHIAVHSIFAGFTNFTTGFIQRKPVIIPIEYILNAGKRKIDLNKNDDYRTMMASTGQPSFNYNSSVFTKSTNKA